MSAESSIPETRVLAIASHLNPAHGHRIPAKRTISYVGNTMATFILQALGCEVSAINTVHYSNHTAYKQVKGRKTPAEEIMELYEGLKQSFLNDFDVLLSGYMPSAEAVQAVGKIGRDLRLNAAGKPGSFFWVLDPVMGDQGRCYVPEDEIPQYKALLREADLILPNQFEAELLSETKITSLTTLATAMQALHRTYQIPHIIITSLRLSADGTISPSTATNPTHLTIIGSTARQDLSPRLFRLDIPAYPLFFSGTGDMFAALTVPRLREAAAEAGLLGTAAWRSPDDVGAVELPLARAVERVLESMQAVLGATATYAARAVEALDAAEGRAGLGSSDGEDDVGRRRHLGLMKASEVRVVQNARHLLLGPEREGEPLRVKFRALEVRVEGFDGGAGAPRADELGVVNLGVGARKGEGEGAVVVGRPGS